MSVTMTIYDTTSAWDTLTRNPITVAEMDAFFSDAGTTVLGTRPFNTTYGYWAEDTVPGYDITQYDKIAFIIEYQLQITENIEYEFNLNSDDFGDLYVGGTLVSYEVGGSDVSVNTPITLAPGTYTLKLRVQNGVGPFGFDISWKKQGESSLYPLSHSDVGLQEDNAGASSRTFVDDPVFIDYPHKLTVRTTLDDNFVQRRVVVQNRASGSYIASAITDEEGLAVFTRLPNQAIDEPHVITCFDDRESGYLNALVYDRVFQVTNQGFPPEN